MQRTVAYDRDALGSKPSEMVGMEEMLQREEEEMVDNGIGMEEMGMEINEEEMEEMLENNVGKNFGDNDFGTSSAKWYRGSEMGKKQF